jgi:RNA polymerase sigma-70 factor (ECF subfamily)
MVCGSQRTGDYTSRLIDKYSDMIFRLAYSYTQSREDSEDILQEVFLRYLKSKIVFMSQEHEKAWFIRVAINCSKTLLSSSWRKKTLLYEDVAADIVNSPDDTGAVLAAVMSLPPVPRLIVHLYYYEELSVKEISLCTKIKESTVKSHLFRARNTLKSILKGEDIDV